MPFATAVTSRPAADRSRGPELLLLRLAVDGVLELLAGREPRQVAGRHDDRRLRLPRVPRDPLVPAAAFEGSESDERHAIAHRDRFPDDPDRGVDRPTDLRLARSGGLG